MLCVLFQMWICRQLTFEFEKIRDIPKLLLLKNQSFTASHIPAGKMQTVIFWKHLIHPIFERAKDNIMSKHCGKAMKLNIGIAGCCEEKKKKKCKPDEYACVVLPICDCDPDALLPEGGEPGDHLVKDGDNNPVWKLNNECDCDPEALLPNGGEPGDHLIKDDNNNPVWKPANECGCEPGDLLPRDRTPGDHLVVDENNMVVWAPEKKQPTAAQIFYVRRDGNDKNSGLENTPESAFQTIKGAIVAIQQRQHTSDYRVEIRIAEGEYNDDYIRINASTISSASVSIIGAGIDKTLITAPISTSPLICMEGLLFVTDLTVGRNAATNNTAVGGVHGNSGNMYLNGIKINLQDHTGSARATSGISAANCGLVAIVDTVVIDGNAAHLLLASNSGSITFVAGSAGGCTLAVSNSTAEYSATATTNGIISLGGLNSVSYTAQNSSINSKYNVDFNGIIMTYGHGAAAFPGTNPGSANYGGQFV